MKRTIRLLPLLILCACPALLVRPAGADEKKPKPAAEAAVDAKEKARFITILSDAYRLSDAGKETESPLTLVNAGALFLRLVGNEKLITENKAEPAEEYEKDAEKGEAAPKEKPKLKFDFKEEADELFDTASAWAKGDNKKAIDALIKAVKADKEGKLVFEGKNDEDGRGNIRGPAAITRKMPGGATHVHKFSFASGLPAAVGFRSTSPCYFTIVRADIDVVIYAGVTTSVVRNWTPAKDGKFHTFTVRVKNLTRKPAQYQLLTN